MKNVLISVVLLLCFPLHTLGGTILVLGDSISAAYGIPSESGWVTLLDRHLEERFPRTFTVVNASVSGDTTAGGLVRLPSLLDKHDPALVIVELGGNDGLRGMALAGIEDNLRQMVRMSQDHGSQVALVSVNLPVSYGVHFNRLFTKVFEDVARDEDILHVAMGFENLNDRRLLQDDGIHPTEEAQPILFDLIWTTIEPAVHEIANGASQLGGLYGRGL